MSENMGIQNVKKGIILAAGDGDRLGSLTTGCPKVLLSVSEGRPLISYPILALAGAEINEIAVVVGHMADRVMEELGDGSRFGVKLRYIVNENYLGGNAISVRVAREWAGGEPVILCMGDHTIEAGLIGRLSQSGNADNTLCVDYTPGKHHEIEEATKVVVDNTGCIKNIGKEIARWNALDTGVFLLTSSFFEAIEELVRKNGLDVEMSDVISRLTTRGQFFNTCDVSGCFWMDVDTEEDLNLVRM
jgi:choline kinase